MCRVSKIFSNLKTKINLSRFLNSGRQRQFSGEFFFFFFFYQFGSGAVFQQFLIIVQRRIIRSPGMSDRNFFRWILRTWIFLDRFWNLNEKIFIFNNKNFTKIKVFISYLHWRFFYLLQIEFQNVRRKKNRRIFAFAFQGTKMFFCQRNWIRTFAPNIENFPFFWNFFRFRNSFRFDLQFFLIFGSRLRSWIEILMK